MSANIRYPLGNQSFEKVRLDHRLYIDKTGFIKRLTDISNFIFLGRPRRFGKSLLLSTIEAYFKGKKELFEGLEISREETDWIEYPIIHIDFSSVASNDGVPLRAKIRGLLCEIASGYGIGLEADEGIDGLLGEVILRLKEVTGHNVVVLVDEYDVPVHGIPIDSEAYKEKRETLRSFFMQCKANDAHIKFCMVTGVARFNQESLFSAPNNFVDISMYPEFAGVCGFTHEEVCRDLRIGISHIAMEAGMTEDDVYRQFVAHYDGYRFTKSKETVFNPMSILFSVVNREFGNYWINTGLTSLFVERLSDPRFELPKLTSEWVSEQKLNKIYDPADPMSLMFQTGYLTITDYDRELGLYRLGIPNQEVMNSLTECLLPEYTGKDDVDTVRQLSELNVALKRGQVENMMSIIGAVISSVAYHQFPKGKESLEVRENYFHTIFYILFMMLKSYTVCEKASSKGRADMVAETNRFVYIFEFKMDDAPDGTVEDALRQIEDSGYADQYRHSGKQVFKIGVVFSNKTHDIADWKSIP